ncbi:MAG TPA: hypothetical protein VM097_05545 [Mycobacteriales bacterium]|nr:hypothetical protein [Mycobacteriales bacterium]
MLVLLLAVLAPGGAEAATGRVRVDRPGTPGPRVHLVYLVAQGQPDRHRDTDGSLARAAEQLQRWTARETGGRRWRLDTFRSGGRTLADITFVRSPRTTYDVCPLDPQADPVTLAGQHVDCLSSLVDPNGDPWAKVRDDLAAAGLKEPGVRYLVLVQGTASIICGMAQGPDDGDRDPSHVGVVSAVFLGEEACPNDVPGTGGTVDWALAHELLHGDGVVPVGAPHYCAGASGHVCTAGLANGSPVTDSLDPERADILYPSPGIGLLDAHLDPGHDDYFETAIGLRDLADSPYLTKGR